DGGRRGGCAQADLRGAAQRDAGRRLRASGAARPRGGARRRYRYQRRVAPRVRTQEAAMRDAAADSTAASTSAEPDAPQASRWASACRIVVEFALLFAIAVVAKQILAASTTGSYPNPLWLPVIVLSLQHGLAAGLAAAVIAAGLQYWDGLPPALMAEDMYAYIGRIAAEPVGAACAALLICSTRSRPITPTR